MLLNGEGSETVSRVKGGEAVNGIRHQNLALSTELVRKQRRTTGSQDKR